MTLLIDSDEKHFDFIATILVASTMHSAARVEIYCTVISLLDIFLFVCKDYNFVVLFGDDFRVTVVILSLPNICISVCSGIR
jgi:hypothetical protein